MRNRMCFLAVTVVLAGLCGMLLLGTRYVPAAALLLATALGAWLAARGLREGLPGHYLVAQLIDRRFGLLDHLSTAYHFRSDAGAVVNEQYGLAARQAETVDPRAAFPYRAPTTLRSSAYLLAIALILLGLRAGIQTSLSFEPPLATLLLGHLWGSQPMPEQERSFEAARIARDSEPKAELTGEREDEPSEASGEPARDLPEEEDRWTEEDLSDLPEVEGLITLPTEEQQVMGPVQDDLAGDAAEEGAPGDDNGDLPSSDEWSDEAQSLLEKLKQAFDNMLQTLEMASSESPQGEPGERESSGSADPSDAAGEPSDDGSPTEETASDAAQASMEGGQPGQEAGETASVGNTSGEDSAGNQSGGQEASAAGTSDGTKEFEEAEHLQVLGALEELYMERAENMTGDITIETRRAEQSATVPYTPQTTSHVDRGGAVSRDEIPPAYRTYVRNYFETLRRTAQ